MAFVSSTDSSNPSGRLSIVAAGDDFRTFVSGDASEEAEADSSDGVTHGAPDNDGMASAEPIETDHEHPDFFYQPNAPMGEASQMIAYAIQHYEPPVYAGDDETEDNGDSDEQTEQSDEDEVPDFGDRIIGAGLTVRDLLNGDYSKMDLSDPFAHQRQPIAGSAALGDPMGYLSSMSAELS